MTKYNLRKIEGGQVLGTFETKQEAADWMQEYITKYNDWMNSSNDYLTPFDFTIDEIESKEINEVVTTYKEAVNYLIHIHYYHPVDDVLIQDLESNPSQTKALIAFNRLCTIAKAWNKADGFKPDFSNTSQYKFFPWFVYDDGAAVFVCAYTNSASTHAPSYIGSRLCFKTRERAMQFGKQFIDLWNQVLLE